MAETIQSIVFRIGQTVRFTSKKGYTLPAGEVGKIYAYWPATADRPACWGVNFPADFQSPEGRSHCATADELRAEHAPTPLEATPFPVLINPPRYPTCSGVSDATMAQWTREYIRQHMVCGEQPDLQEMWFRTVSGRGPLRFQRELALS